METGKIIAWGIVASILGVIVFVRAGENGGTSGGAQASAIINSTASGASAIINSLEGR